MGDKICRAFYRHSDETVIMRKYIPNMNKCENGCSNFSASFRVVEIKLAEVIAKLLIFFNILRAVARKVTWLWATVFFALHLYLPLLIYSLHTLPGTHLNDTAFRKRHDKLIKLWEIMFFHLVWGDLRRFLRYPWWLSVFRLKWLVVATTFYMAELQRFGNAANQGIKLRTSLKLELNIAKPQTLWLIWNEQSLEEREMWGLPGAPGYANI